MKAEQLEKAVELGKAYHRCFNTDDGQKVLTDLSNRFLIDVNIPFESANINYQAAYHNGEAGLVRFIIHKIQQAEKL